jgi:hypothetical protein
MQIKARQALHSTDEGFNANVRMHKCKGAPAAAGDVVSWKSERIENVNKRIG